MSVSVLAKNTCQTTGEGPFWEESSSSLLYVDITQCDVHRWNSTTGEDTKIHLDDTVSFIIPRSIKGSYVIGYGQSISTLEWDTGKVVQLCAVEQGKNTRFNDAKCDTGGRLWAGTAPADSALQQGTLYSVGSDHVIRHHVGNINMSNGLAWSLDNRTMYYIDSIVRQVYAFDFDVTSGSISNQRTAVHFGEGTEATLGVPDGMTIDHEGKLWVACYGAGKVVRFDPETGKQLQTVNFRTEKTTSCCFGGLGYSELYVTTGYMDLEQQQLAGSIFRVTDLGVHGFPASSFLG